MAGKEQAVEAELGALAQHQSAVYPRGFLGCLTLKISEQSEMCSPKNFLGIDP
jgi:hypothetical protein